MILATLIYPTQINIINRTKGAMDLGVSSCESSDTEEERPDILEKAMRDDEHWVDLDDINKTHVPPLSLHNIHRYFIKRRVRKDQVTASKPFERGYRIYDAKKVQSISIYSPTDDSLFRVISAHVHPSQKTDRIYRTFIVAYKTSGEIYHAICSCTAGEGGSCNHIAALSFAIDDYNRKLPTPSCTSVPSKWNVPKNIKEPKDIPISNLHIKKPSYIKPKNTGLSSPHIPISPQLSQVTIQRIMKLRQDLSQHSTDTLVFHQVWPETINKEQLARLQSSQHTSTSSPPTSPQ